jgi:hypothetical protein
VQAISEQLEMFGIDGARRQADGAAASPHERSRPLRRVDVAHELMSSLPAAEDLSLQMAELKEPVNAWPRNGGRPELRRRSACSSRPSARPSNGTRSGSVCRHGVRWRWHRQRYADCSPSAHIGYAYAPGAPFCGREGNDAPIPASRLSSPDARPGRRRLGPEVCNCEGSHRAGHRCGFGPGSRCM